VDFFVEKILNLRYKYQLLEKVALRRLWKKSITRIPLNRGAIKLLFTKHLDEFPGIVKGYNQAEFLSKIYKNGKFVDEISEYSISSYPNPNFIRRFGPGPNWRLPENTIDILSDLEKFEKFVQRAFDFDGTSRKFDSEIKFIYNFLKKHIDKGDEFVIEFKSLLTPCDSCIREFIMLKELLEGMGKKVKFVVHDDLRIRKFGDISKTYPEMKVEIKKYEKLYKKNKKQWK